ncbi:MAG: serine/threonine protein kinase [Piscinibacter sp.]
MNPPRDLQDTPYAGLAPEVVLDALDAVGLRGDGRLIQLNSYENRVFQVFLEDGRVVVAKFYRPGRWSDAQILEEHDFAAELAAHEVPLAAPWPLTHDDRSLHAERLKLLAPTLASFDSVDGPYRFAVTERKAGRAPEVEDPAVLEWIGRFIGRLHAVGVRGRFEQRLTLSPASLGTEPRDWLLAHEVPPPDALPAWRSMVDAALERVQSAFAAAAPLRTLRLHGDCHLGNILWTGAGPHFVDLDDALTGPAVQDLWMLLSGSRAERQKQLGAVLDGYEQFMDFDRRELALIEPLRTLRMVHHSAWIARRWKDPAFPVAFPWFESPAYWTEQATRLRDQLEAMDEAPLVA